MFGEKMIFTFSNQSHLMNTWSSIHKDVMNNNLYFSTSDSQTIPFNREIMCFLSPFVSSLIKGTCACEDTTISLPNIISKTVYDLKTLIINGSVNGLSYQAVDALKSLLNFLFIKISFVKKESDDEDPTLDYPGKARIMVEPASPNSGTAGSPRVPPLPPISSRSGLNPPSATPPPPSQSPRASRPASPEKRPAAPSSPSRPLPDIPAPVPDSSGINTPSRQAGAPVVVTIWLSQLKKGRCGPFLDPVKVERLPQQFGPAPIHRVLRESVQNLVDAALDQKQMFGLLRQGEGKVIITASFEDKMQSVRLPLIEKEPALWDFIEMLFEELRCESFFHKERPRIKETATPLKISLNMKGRKRRASLSNSSTSSDRRSPSPGQPPTKNSRLESESTLGKYNGLNKLPSANRGRNLGSGNKNSSKSEKSSKHSNNRKSATVSPSRSGPPPNPIYTSTPQQTVTHPSNVPPFTSQYMQIPQMPSNYTQDTRNHPQEPPINYQPPTPNHPQAPLNQPQGPPNHPQAPLNQPQGPLNHPQPSPTHPQPPLNIPQPPLSHSQPPPVNSPQPPPNRPPPVVNQQAPLNHHPMHPLPKQPILQVPTPTPPPPPKKEISPMAEDWNVEDTITSVCILDPGLAPHVEMFRNHEIDGQALLLLTSEMMMKHLGMKLGPALKICNIIEKLKGRKYQPIG